MHKFSPIPMNQHLRRALGLLAATSLALGCGGGTPGGGGSGNTSPTIALVNVIAASSSITLAQTANCVAQVIGTGAYSSAVTWTATNATITSAGVLTPTAVGTATCTATSTQDTTKFGSTNITVAAAPPTITSVTVSATPSTITTAQTSTCSATVLGTGAFSSAVTWTATNGTITTGGVFTPASIGTGSCKATSVQDVTKSGSATITIPAPTITSVSVACNPSAILTTQTTTCTASVQGTGASSTGVNWTATGGTVTSGGVATPSGAGTMIVTATSTQDSTKSGSANVVVTQPALSITSLSVNGVNFPARYTDSFGGIIILQINGTGFLPTDTVTSVPNDNFPAPIITPTQITLGLGLDSFHTELGWQTFTVCHSGGITCATSSFGLIGHNFLALSPNGQMNYLDGNSNVIWQYKSDGTPNNGIAGFSLGSGIAVDNISSNILISGLAGAIVSIPGQGGGGNGNPALGIDAKNGVACVTQPTVNAIGCYPITQSYNTFQPFNTTNAGAQPWSLAMGFFNGVLHTYVISRSGTVTLWDITNLPSGPATSNSAAIPGSTPIEQITGFVYGWHIEVFDSGPASGTLAVLSTFDNLLTFHNTSTLKVTQTVKLTGIPFLIAKDQSNGNLIVAYVDQPHMLTTFAKVNPTTGVVTPLTTTTSFLTTGLRITPDGLHIDACNQNVCQVLPNQ